jgi:hypothetical protein
MKKDIQDSLNQRLYECNKHIEKINDAKEYLKDLMPLSVDSYLKIDKIQSSFIDQLIFRFSKLQDTIGGFLFKAILILAKEDVKSMTFLDILNRLEELKIIDKNRWLYLRESRNEIAHEYSFNQEEVVDNINMIYEKTDELIKVYESILNFISEIKKKS